MSSKSTSSVTGMPNVSMGMSASSSYQLLHYAYIRKMLKTDITDVVVVSKKKTNKKCSL